jgi:Na+/phosphate symporter
MVHSGILRAFGPELRLLLARALNNRFTAFADKRTSDSLRIAFGMFMSGDVTQARQLLAEKAALRNTELAATERHLDRLREGRPETLETSLHQTQAPSQDRKRAR